MSYYRMVVAAVLAGLVLIALAGCSSGGEHGAASVAQINATTQAPITGPMGPTAEQIAQMPPDQRAAAQGMHQHILDIIAMEKANALKQAQLSQEKK